METLNDVRLPKVLGVEPFLKAHEPEFSLLLDQLKHDHGRENVGLPVNPRSLRRRTNAFKSYSHKRRPNAKKQKLEAAALQDMDPEQEGATEEVPAKFENRRMRRKRSRLLASMTAEPPDAPGGHIRRLETHIWHAKRMEMTQLWGFMLAKGAFGKGHGSRGLLRKLSGAAVIHDASYLCPFHLSGTRHNLSVLLSKLCDPAEIEKLNDEDDFWGGRRQERGMLHNPHSFPGQAITPFILLASPVLPGGMQNLWLWIHPAALAEAETAISLAAEDLDVSVGNVRAQLGRIEMRGKAADSLLAKSLAVHKPDAEANIEAGPSGEQEADILGSSESVWHQATAQGDASGLTQLGGNAVLHLRVHDPRLARPMPEAGKADCIPPSQRLGGETLLELVSQQKGTPQGLSEQSVSEIRHRTRQEALGLGPIVPVASHPSEECTHTPVVAVRSQEHGKIVSWSLVAPKGWILPLWQALAFKGAAPCGQREWKWVAAQQGQCIFPEDCPDTEAGKEFEMLRFAEEAAERKLRPKGRFPDPAAPDWSKVGQSVSSSAARLQFGDVEESPGGPHGGPTSGLLPPGSFVARSKATLQVALQSAQPRQDILSITEAIEAAGGSDQSNPVGDEPEDAEMLDVADEAEAREVGKDSHCYVRCKLRFRPEPGTAEFGAAVFALPEQLSSGNVHHEMSPAAVQPSENAETPNVTSSALPAVEKLSIHPSTVSPEESKTKGVKITGQTLIGFVTTGEVRGLTAESGASAMLRADLLFSKIATVDDTTLQGLKVLVKNPRSTVAHSAQVIVSLAASGRDDCFM